MPLTGDTRTHGQGELNVGSRDQLLCSPSSCPTQWRTATAVRGAVATLCARLVLGRTCAQTHSGSLSHRETGSQSPIGTGGRCRDAHVGGGESRLLFAARRYGCCCVRVDIISMIAFLYVLGLLDVRRPGHQLILPRAFLCTHVCDCVCVCVFSGPGSSTPEPKFGDRVRMCTFVLCENGRESMRCTRAGRRYNMCVCACVYRRLPCAPPVSRGCEGATGHALCA